ncbi:MAG: 3-dehydroquinate synthase [Eubacteriales bacterium]|nr:3-dehydroquinate synthase [Eubacteriales bacterium]
MKTVMVHTAKPYEVRIGCGLLGQAGEWLTSLTKARVAALITDDTVDALYGDTVASALAGAGLRVERMCFPHGEASKTLETYGKILCFLAEHRLTRSDAVVALGGGVTGDLAGFAAATYLRGIAVMQIPTTLLAMVDSSVGGKTGVNLPAGKNLVGAFHQPVGVLCDPDMLSTLPPEVFADGTAEAIKCGVLCDEALFATLATGDWRADIEAVIARCVSIKADVCAEDEREANRRQLLNLGHTFGHAIERLSDYSLPHGHAVAVGMVYAARIATSLGRCEADCLLRLEAALAKNGLPITAGYSSDALANAALIDKKRAGDTLTFVLPQWIGVCELVPVPVERLPELSRLATGETTI